MSYHLSFQKNMGVLNFFLCVYIISFLFPIFNMFGSIYPHNLLIIAWMYGPLLSITRVEGLHIQAVVRKCYGYMDTITLDKQGRIQGGGGGGAPGARAPKIGKNMIFWRKIVIFHTKYPNIFRASLRNWKEYDFLA